MTTSIVVLVNQADSAYIRNMHQAWVQLLFPPGFDTLTSNQLTYYPDQFFITRAGEAVDSLDHIVHGAFRLANRSVSSVSMEATPVLRQVSRSGQVHEVHLHSPAAWEAWRDGQLPDATTCTCLAGTKGNALPAPECPAPLQWSGNCNLAHWLRDTERVTVAMQFKGFNPRRVLVTSAACTLWSVVVRVELPTPAQARVSVHNDMSACPDFDLTHSPAFALCIALVVVVLLHQGMLTGRGLREWGVVRDLMLLSKLAKVVPDSLAQEVTARHAAWVQASTAVHGGAKERAACRAQTATPSPSTTEAAVAAIRARQLCTPPMTCGGDGGMAPLPSSCYGLVCLPIPCAPRRLVGPTPGPCRRCLWTCGPGSWWPLHWVDLCISSLCHSPVSASERSPSAHEHREAEVQLSGSGHLQEPPSPPLGSLDSQHWTWANSMQLEGVVLGSSYTVVQLLMDSTWYGVHWLAAWGDPYVGPTEDDEDDEGRAAAPPTCIASAQGPAADAAPAPQQSMAAAVVLADQPALDEVFERDGLEDGDSIAFHCCFVECISRQASGAALGDEPSSLSSAEVQLLSVVKEELREASTGGEGGGAPFSAITLLLTSPYTRGHLTAWELAEMLSPWTLLSTAANFMTLIYAVMVITLGEVSVPPEAAAAFAFGAFLQWLTLAQYLRHQAHFYIVMRTLARGTPALVQFLAGVLPIFAGCVVFAAAVFGTNTIRFDGMEHTAITLFAVRLLCMQP